MNDWDSFFSFILLHQSFSKLQDSLEDSQNTYRTDEEALGIEFFSDFVH